MDGVRNMNKYDTMLAVNKKRNKRKIDTAKKEIYKMLENGEKVTVTKLIEQTGLSRGFFYKNEQVRQKLEEAIKQPRRIDVQQSSEERNVAGHNFQELKKDFNSFFKSAVYFKKRWTR